MPRRLPLDAAKSPDRALILLTTFLAVLWLAGGASRADVMGQTITRLAAWAIAIAAILFATRPRWEGVAPVAIILGTAALLAMAQLIPLPPSIWTALPGRELLVHSATVSAQEQPWRPLSLSPGATFNALSSLIVPFVILLLLAGLCDENRWRILALLLGLIVASCLVGLIQFAGIGFNHPLINDGPGPNANFANRNHFALFAACGCVLAPVWASRESQSPRWRAFFAAGLLIFFILTVLATGSRAGILLSAAAAFLGVASVRHRIRESLGELPRAVRIPFFLLIAALLASAVMLSVGLDRATSVDRALALEIGQDLRRLALPTVFGMTGEYWPAGAGFGTFDAAYRIDEPASLLGRSYLNHAHNDLLETVLDGGLAGLLLLFGALAWAGWNGFRAWRTPLRSGSLLPRAGFNLLLLVALASVFDYPARTPLIMALAVIAAVWLTGGSKAKGQSGTLTSFEAN